MVYQRKQHHDQSVESDEKDQTHSDIEPTQRNNHDIKAGKEIVKVLPGVQHVSKVIMGCNMYGVGKALHHKKIARCWSKVSEIFLKLCLQLYSYFEYIVITITKELAMIPTVSITISIKIAGIAPYIVSSFLCIS